jgi:hypothetical protein
MANAVAFSKSRGFWSVLEAAKNELDGKSDCD